MSSIYNYGYKPIPVYKTSHDEFENTSDVKELLFGVELEIDKGDDAGETSDELVECSRDIYCKHDGSLGCEGIEIVTHPCTLDYHMNCLDWPGLIKIAKAHSYKSHEARTCGLHVHVGRFQMGMFEKDRDRTVANIVILVSRFWQEMVTFSRRRANQLESWANCNMPTPNYYGQVKEEVVSAALGTRDRGRYLAVNLCNSSTVEFRLFNGTLNLDTLKATLQMVSNIVTYAKEHTPNEVLASQWQDIIDVAHYDELTFYLNEKGLSLVPPKPVIEFKFETTAEHEAYLAKKRAEEERRRQIEMVKDRIRREIKELRRLTLMRKVKVGDRVKITNNVGYDVRCLRYGIGTTAIITAVVRDSYFDFEIKFEDTHMAGVYGHSSSYGNKGTGYYNVHVENVELVRETEPVAEPMLAAAV